LEHYVTEQEAKTAISDLKQLRVSLFRQWQKGGTASGYRNN